MVHFISSCKNKNPWELEHPERWESVPRGYNSYTTLSLCFLYYSPEFKLSTTS
nr:MAG TPA: hypothetical protein [Caudoviricetes sp.]